MKTKKGSLSISTLIIAILVVLFIVLMYTVQAGGINNVMEDAFELISVDQKRETQTGNQRVVRSQAINLANNFVESLKSISDIQGQSTCFAAIEPIDMSILEAGYMYELKRSSSGIDFRLKKFTEDDRGNFDTLESVGRSVSINGLSPCVISGRDDAQFFIDIIKGEETIVSLGSDNFGKSIDNLTIHGYEGGWRYDRAFIELENKRVNFDANFENNYLVVLKKGSDLCFMESNTDGINWVGSDCRENDLLGPDCYEGNNLPELLLGSSSGEDYICDGNEDRFKQLRNN